MISLASLTLNRQLPQDPENKAIKVTAKLDSVFLIGVRLKTEIMTDASYTVPQESPTPICLNSL